MCGWININVHTVFTLLVASFVILSWNLLHCLSKVILFTSLTAFFPFISPASVFLFLFLFVLLHFSPFLLLPSSLHFLSFPCFRPPLSWYSSYCSGPEPPTDIVFTEVTDNSLTVSWTKPKSAISGFKVTYTHTDEGENWHPCFIKSNINVILGHLCVFYFLQLLTNRTNCQQMWFWFSGVSSFQLNLNSNII